MRTEVESLLSHYQAGDDFIEKPALHIAAETFVREGAYRVGQIIGDYEIVSLIGTGGMGEVYLAHDRQLHRRVALKLIRRGMDSADIVRHFKREERLLAGLNHPNIAQLYGSGMTADGVPFFAMEFVEGTPIDEYCNEKQLSIPIRLELFRKVCGAVHYAHQHLVVHRDVKPSNILVTTEGEPKLLDFGIAKLLETDSSRDLVRTITELRALTPEYASPEQIRGENVTTATDIYSLGVVLYGLLTGHKPYRLRTARPDELSRAICEDEPTKPSTAVANHDGNSKFEIRNSKFLKGDLDNIILMAMRKEPSRRYASVAQFSEDIRRHSEGLPVRARKDTWNYRAAKFVHRHKVGVAAAAVIVLTLVAGVIAASWQANRATRQAKLAAQARDRAQRRFEDVRHLSNALLFDIAPKIERLEGATEARQSLLTQSLKYLDSLAAESGEDPALQSELAAAYEKIGDLQGNPRNPNLMVLTDALASYQKANEIRRALLQRNPRDREQRRLLANNYRVLGDLRWQTNEPVQSQKDSEAALGLYTGLLAEQPESPELRLGLARTNNDIGQLFSTNEKHADAIPYFVKAIGVTEELRQQFPDKIDILTCLAAAHQGLGNALSWTGQQKEGEAEMAKAIEIYEPLVAKNPNDSNLRSELYRTYVMTSSVYESVNDTLATEYAFKALKVAETAAEKDPVNLRANHYLAMAYSRVGVTLPNIGQAAESIPYLKKAVSIFEELVGKETKNRRYKLQLGLAFLRLGDARRKQDDLNGALEDLGKAVAIYSELVSNDANDNASLKNLASAHKSLGEAHDTIAQSSDEKKPFHQQMAERHFRNARDIFLKLQAQKTLSEFDAKTLEETQAAVLKYRRQ
ncbi:MAG TPA: protein kinase [Chthoniobacterales bacterium]|nr:protein kinase [Chthoniobacterales bacterium]